MLFSDGGPGDSSLFDIFVANGPYYVDKDLNVYENNYSWTREFSMLYFDNPVGVGFSFSRDNEGLSKDEESIADYLYEALQQFFTLFYDYRDNDFYLAGYSYAGKYIPALGHKLHTLRKDSKINFKGCSIGAGWIDPITMLGYGPYLQNIGLIDEKQAEHFNSVERKTIRELKKGNYLKAFDIHSQVLRNSINLNNFNNNLFSKK